MKIPAPVERVALAMVIGVVFCILWAQTVGAKPVVVDYCAMAELSTCRVVQSGTWTIVSTPANAAYILIFDKAGKLTQVQKIQ